MPLMHLNLSTLTSPMSSTNINMSSYPSRKYKLTNLRFFFCKVDTNNSKVFTRSHGLFILNLSSNFQRNDNKQQHLYVDFNMTSFDASDFGNKVMREALGGLSLKTRKLAQQVGIQIMRNFRFRVAKPNLGNTKLVVMADVADIDDDGEDDVDKGALQNYLSRKTMNFFKTQHHLRQKFDQYDNSGDNNITSRSMSMGSTSRHFGFGILVNDNINNDQLDKENMRFPELEEVDDNNADEFNQALNILMSRHELDEDDALTKPGREFDRTTLKMLSKIKPTVASTKAEEIKEDSVCSICLEKMTAVEELKTLRCKHMFHTKCIFNWLNKRNCCPYCRSSSLALIDL